MTEKEQVYGELDALRKRCADQRVEIRLLHKSTDARQNAALRRETREYRKALSNILHRLENGGVAADDLRSIVESALLLRGLKQGQRDAIVAAHDDRAENQTQGSAPRGSHDPEDMA